MFASSLGLCLGFVDVVRAYFHSKARRRVCVELPEVDNQDGTHGRLKKAMRGTREAAQNWELEYSEMMTSPCCTRRWFYRIRI